MADEERRVFKLDVVLALFAGKVDAQVSDLLGYLTGRELSKHDESVVATLAQAWLASLEPKLLETSFDDTAIYDDWVKKEKGRIADNISVTPIPHEHLAPVLEVIDGLAAARAANKDLSAQVAELEAKVAELEPYVAKSEELEKKVEGLEGQVEDLQTQLAESKKAAKEFEGKVAVDESGLDSTIKDLVTKAIKDAAASVTIAAPAGGEGAPAAAATADAGPTDSPGEVSSDFGFGTDDGGGGGFGF